MKMKTPPRFRVVIYILVDYLLGVEVRTRTCVKVGDTSSARCSLYLHALRVRIHLHTNYLHSSAPNTSTVNTPPHHTNYQQTLALGRKHVGPVLCGDAHIQTSLMAVSEVREGSETSRRVAGMVARLEVRENRGN